jgi:imidazolonepropionase
MAKLLLVNARIATMRDGRYSIIENGGLAAADGVITSVGPMRTLDTARRASDVEVLDARGSLVTPGLIDCHTHLVYAGNRAHEFEMRLNGATYEEIARSGGGILSTVKATRAAGGDELRAQSRPRIDALIAEGVTTVEIKSGYGLDTKNELKCLRVAQSLASGSAVRVRTTLLGAHTVAPEFKGRADAYVDLVCGEMIPAAAKQGLASAVDAFCEGIGFTPAQTRRVFEAARAHGLKIKLHADQLSNLGGAALAAEFDAVSADHLEHTDEEGVKALAMAGTVAVLLPGAFYYLRETQMPPIEALRKHRVPIAIASDCNPGTSPCASILTIANMACTLFRLTPEESLAGITTHAARALGLRDCGTLEPDKRCDFAIWDLDDPAQIAWQIAGLKPREVVFEGKPREGHGGNSITSSLRS